MCCKKTEKFIKAQVKLIEANISLHQFYHNIPDREKAISDFISMFGDLFRQLCCDMCEEEDCKLKHDHP